LEILYLPFDSSNHTGLFKKLSDISIINGILNQDDYILNCLYDNYLQTVKKHVLNNNGSDDDVSDVFQDTIIVLYNQIVSDTLNLTTDLKGYFFGIARNVWSAQLRIKQRTVKLEIDLPDEDETEEQPDRVLERIISRVFIKLKPDQQMILKMFSDGLSYDEIAIKMNLKNGVYARRKKYLSKESLIELMKEDPEYQDFFRFRK
jgi:RNA polymerase sigma factor (sigma-70 family)